MSSERPGGARRAFLFFTRISFCRHEATSLRRRTIFVASVHTGVRD
jgi:hypothetical protein